MGWRQRVVVVGGGFGGIAVARALRHELVDVLVLDRTNHHLFQPLLYQVATCALSPAEIASPIRSVLGRQRNAEVLFAEVKHVNLAARCLETSCGPVDYHFLVLAAGARSNYFGHPEWPKLTTGLKSLDDAVEVRCKVLMALEIAEQETNPRRRRELLTFCVIGGGPTGVELAGALIELSRTIVRRDFRHIQPSEISVILVEGSESVLKSFPTSLRRRAMAQLKRLGVDVMTEARVIRIAEQGMTIRDQAGEEHQVPASTILWAAGVRAAALSKTLGVELDRAGRVKVTTSLNVPGYDEVFCIGDMAACVDSRGVEVPGVAPAAMQQGRFAARQIMRRIQGLPVEPFRYKNKGNLATIGRSAAVAELGPLKLSGFVAWLLWLVVHLLFLVGFRNRYLVLVQWTWHYFAYSGGARLITGVPLDELSLPLQPRRLGKAVRSASVAPATKPVAG